MINIKEIDFEKLNGLVPAIIIDNRSNDVLMLGFMNEEALNKTLKTGKVTFYSRSRKKLWTKGETSGNYLNLIEINADCDNDTLLIKADPVGNTCHKGTYSCFGIEKNKFQFFKYLEELIARRKKEMPENSYTTSLFKKGENRIIQKVGEEAIETVIAAKNNDREEIINETSDLIFHLLVLLTEKGISINDIVGNLESRHK